MTEAMGRLDTLSLNARAYQLEMIEESLKRNIVVAVSNQLFYTTTLF